MARLALINKTNNRQLRAERQKAAGVKITHPTKVYNRCKNCGRIGGYMRRFDLCRICVKEYARDCKIMGLKKSSW